MMHYPSPDLRDLRKYEAVHRRLLEKGTDKEALEQAHALHKQAILWRAIELRQQNCRNCVLCEKAEHKVPGVGSYYSPLMIVGEGPGEMEDHFFVPFIGDAGYILTMTLAKAGVNRNSIFISNVVKCRPPGNRQPSLEECKACLPILIAEIRQLQPKVILTLGNPALWTLRENPDLRISSERGRWQQCRLPQGVTIPMLHTYHPSYVLRKLDEPGAERVKLQFWEDIKSAVQRAVELAPGYRFSQA